MKEPSKTRVTTEHSFYFGSGEVGSVDRLWGLSVKYVKEIRSNRGDEELTETVSAFGSVGEEHNSGISSFQLSLCFRVKNKEYCSIEELSSIGYLPNRDLIRKQAISLMRKELPDYVVSILPEG